VRRGIFLALLALRGSMRREDRSVGDAKSRRRNSIEYSVMFKANCPDSISVAARTVSTTARSFIEAGGLAVQPASLCRSLM
jgi:hypothetical protein